MKFKIGDKVRILDGSNIEYYAGGWVDSMEKYVGDVSTIERVQEGREYILSCDEKDFVRWIWDERGLELVEEAEQPNGDEPKVEVNEIANKAHFMKVAAEVTHS